MFKLKALQIEIEGVCMESVVIKRIVGTCEYYMCGHHHDRANSRSNPNADLLILLFETGRWRFINIYRTSLHFWDNTTIVIWVITHKFSHSVDLKKDWTVAPRGQKSWDVSSFMGHIPQKALRAWLQKPTRLPLWKEHWWRDGMMNRQRDAEGGCQPCGVMRRV